MKPLVFDQLRKVKHEDRDMMAEDQAQEVSGHQLMGTRMDAMQGDTASAAEKGADFDGGGFLGDGTKIQPAINQIWKVGHLIKRAAYSTYDIEDMDATYQSRLNPSTKDDRATDAGTRDNSTGRRSPDIPIDVAHTDQSHLNPINPGGVGGGDGLQMTSDVPVRGSGVGTGEMEDNPVTEVEPQEPQDERVRIARGLKKRAAVASAWVRAQTSPSRQKLAQALLKRAYKLEGKMDFQGLPIALEHTAGGVRSGIGKDGKPWETHFRYAYGYIDGTKGADGEGLDVFIGPNINADTAFVVHQKKPETGKYDEQKVMLGWDSADEAKQAYLDHYDSPKFFGSIHPVTMDKLRELVAKKKTLIKVASLLQKRAYDVFDADPATLGSDGPPVHFKMPGKVKTSDGDGVPGRLQSAAQALVEPLEPLPTTNPLTEAKREVSDVRKASSLVRKILNNQPLI